MIKRLPVDWRECAFVSFENAGKIAGRSTGWAREMAAAGYLRAVRLPTGGPAVVTVGSLCQLLEQSQSTRPRGTGAPALRLVVSNP